MNETSSIMWDLNYFSPRMKCRTEDKVEILQTVQKLCHYNYLIRRRGLLALWDVLEQEEDPFIRLCLDQLPELLEQAQLKEYMEIAIIAEDAVGKRFLELAVIADGVLKIQQGVDNGALLTRLAAWFGTEFLDKFRAMKEADEEKNSAEERECQERLRKGQLASACPEFDELTECDSKILRKVVRIADFRKLAIAFKEAGYGIYQKISDCMTDEQKRSLEEEGSYLHNLRIYDVAEAQRYIVNLARQVEGDSAE